MKSIELIKLLKEFPKTYYRLVDFEKLTNQNRITTAKTVERMVDSELLTRLTKNVYVRSEQEINLTKIAQELYSSYLSLESSLYQAGIINQPPFVVTLVTSKHSKKTSLGNIDYEYTQLSSKLQWGFELKNEIYQAEPEKAIIDMLYLKSRGNRHFQTDEWDLSVVNKDKLGKYLQRAGVKWEVKN